MYFTRLFVAGLLSLPLAASAFDGYLGAGVASELDGRGPSIGGLDPEGEHARTLVAGFDFSDDFGIEAAWVDLGELSLSNIADAGYNVDGDLWSLGLTYRWDLGVLDPYAKLGWFDRSEDGETITIGGPRRVRFDDDGLMAEAGVRFHLNNTFVLRGGYAWYDFDDNSDGSAQLVLEAHFR